MLNSFAEISRQYPLREQLRRDNIRIFPGGNFSCPFHDDKNPSAHLFRADDGVEKAKCQAGGCEKLFDTVEYISHRDRVSLSEAARILTGTPPMKPRQGPPESHDCVFAAIPPYMLPIAPGTPIRYFNKSGKELIATNAEYVHHYYDDNGDCQGLVVRIGNGKGKRVFQLRYDMNRNALVAKGWSRDDVPPLYNAVALADNLSLPVLLVEGEKVVDLLKPLMPDWVITCWQGGTSTVAFRDFSALDGRDVTIWPDADKPGDNQTDGVGAVAMRAALARFKPRTAWWIDPLEEWYDLAEGFDAVDLLERSGNNAEVVVETIRILRKQLQQEDRQEPSSRYMTADWLPEGFDLVLTKTTRETNVKSEANLWMFLRYHPLLKGRYKFDDFDQKVLADGKELTEAVLRDEMVLISGEHLGLEVTSDKLGMALWAIAQENHINPFGDRLRALADNWDRRTRYMLDYAGVDPSEWSQLVSRRWGIGLARRILEPGSPHDGVMILEGAQGVGKTTFLRTLGNSLGRNLLVTVNELHFKDNKAMKLQGKAIADMSELAALAKGENPAFKAQVGETHDNYRIPYGKRNHDFARTIVFAGTVNPGPEGYLTDPTGNRRIWPVVVKCWGDLKAFDRDKDQIWGELAWRALDGQPSEMQGREAETQKDEATKREFTHPWQHMLEPYLYGKGEVPYADVWDGCLMVPPERRNAGSGRIIGEIMGRLGWEKVQKRDGNARYYIWRRT